ncbi:MAG: flagellar M-ring protein FliF [Deltaproteobacteria bacterium]|nr:flagellar M-ring protein FliF [Deltaproteobacteria bacterium]
MDEQNSNTTVNKLEKFKNDALKTWTGLPKGLRFLMVLILMLAVSGSVVLGVMDFTDEKVLYSGLSEEDASTIVTKLKEKKIHYSLKGGGTTILVPAENVDDLRMELASEGLPTGGGVGFELFDEQRLGMTDFEERVSLTRALEGELSRTISKLDAVKNARIHLVLSKKSLFGAKASAASASVILETKNSRVISEETMQAIVHLVSSGVEGLTPEKVTVVDTRGRLLASGGKTGLSTGGNEFQQKFTQNLENRLKEMLNQIVGVNGSVVRVSADFNFESEERQEESYDPMKTAIRSEQKEIETTGGSVATAGGIPGSRSNLPGGQQPGGGSAGNSTSRQSETKNYEVSKVVRKIVRPGATLSKISVAVLVDGINKPEAPFKPRNSQTLKQIEQAVKGAIGFQKNRGDEVIVESVPFFIPEVLPDAQRIVPPVWKQYVPVGIGAGVFILLALMFLSMRKRTRTMEPEILDSLPLPSAVGELQQIISNSAPAVLQPASLAANNQNNPNNFLINDVRDVFLNESEGASRIIKNWLRESSSHAAMTQGKEK